MEQYRIPELADNYLEHDMIQKHTKLPHFAEFRVKWLYTFLRRGSFSSDFSELYALVTGLLQLGIDTHDLVGTLRHDTEKPTRSRQLRVLAGDYFSGIYYKLLADAREVDLIGLLSQAVCEINQKKVQLYETLRQWRCSSEQFLAHHTDIKMNLFLTFTRKMEGVYYQVSAEVLRLVTRCELLLSELENYTEKEFGQDSWSFLYVYEQASADERDMMVQIDPQQSPHLLHNLYHKYDVKETLSVRLRQLLQPLLSLAKQLGMEGLYQEAQQRCDDLLGVFVSKTAEER